MSAPRELLDQLDALHAAGTADGEWRLQDNGTRHGPEYRYEILDDEGSVAVCSDDNDATDTTGADRTALIVAAVNTLPQLTAALRAADAEIEKQRRLDHVNQYGADRIRDAIAVALSPAQPQSGDRP